ncbi:MAG: hypothetical protein ACLUE1_00990 [Adlercreutzia equolifaciens]
MNVIEKLEILADAAKYDVACTSSGVQRAGKAGQLGAATQAGCCHSFTPDGRCVTLLKVLMTNVCVYDCCYREPREQRRALSHIYASRVGRPHHRLLPSQHTRVVLSSGVAGCPDRTTELMIGPCASCGGYSSGNAARPSPAPRWSSSTIWGACPTVSVVWSCRAARPGAFGPNKSRASILAPCGISGLHRRRCGIALAGEEAHHGVPDPEERPQTAGVRAGRPSTQ